VGRLAPIPLDELRRRVAAVPIWYHRMELAPGVETPGEFDLRPFVGRFGFPASLAGLAAVDVGCSNGFFSFHLESLGAARVAAVELRSVVDHDAPKWYREQEVARRGAREIERLDREQLEAGFLLARDALGSGVEFLRHHVYELERALPGQFDLVFCSGVLHHVRDPVGALENLRATGRPGARFVLGCSCDLSSDASYAVFSGDLAGVTWWTMSREAILRMCRCAGFEEVEWRGHLQLAPRSHPEPIGTVGIVHARVPAWQVRDR
jgi:SAM-dependent methyltransferase